jgi:hypothetical protein
MRKILILCDSDVFKTGQELILGEEIDVAVAGGLIHAGKALFLETIPEAEEADHHVQPELSDSPNSGATHSRRSKIFPKD